MFDDTNFEQATENADPIARRVYRDEAKTIEELRKGIIEVSSKEESYDVFICYKETDENGNRTLDSVLAQDILLQLNNSFHMKSHCILRIAVWQQMGLLLRKKTHR